MSRSKEKYSSFFTLLYFIFLFSLYLFLNLDLREETIAIVNTFVTYYSLALGGLFLVLLLFKMSLNSLLILEDKGLKLVNLFLPSLLFLFPYWDSSLAPLFLLGAWISFLLLCSLRGNKNASIHAHVLGFILGGLSYFDPTLLYLLPFLLWLFYDLNCFSLRNFIALLLGYFLPILIILPIQWYVDPLLCEQTIQSSFTLLISWKSLEMSELIFLIVLGIITLFNLIIYKFDYQSVSNDQRMLFSSFRTLSLSSYICLCFSPSNLMFSSLWLLVNSIFMARFFSGLSIKHYRLFLLFFTLLLVVYMLFI